MIKYLLPKEGNFYKANLHAHSTVSDACLTPEEIKKVYKAKGYSVYAYTDHDVFVCHNDLKDDDFLPLNGYEVEITAEGQQSFNYKKCCHLCFISLDPDKRGAVALHRNAYMFANAPKYKDQMIFEGPDYVRQYTPECINEMISMARNAGFWVSYNHPAWSLEEYPEYMQYKGMNALELFNGSCLVSNYNDNNTRVYDDMLRGGIKIGVVGSDDNHDVHPIGSPLNDSGIAWTMIKAPTLEYKAIANALESGDYYASMGPEIKALYVEDGVLKVDCSEARAIGFTTGIRETGSLRSFDADLTHGEFKVKPDQKYVRVTITDKFGYTAESRAYFIDELL